MFAFNKTLKEAQGPFLLPQRGQGLFHHKLFSLWSRRAPCWFSCSHLSVPAAERGLSYSQFAEFSGWGRSLHDFLFQEEAPHGRGLSPRAHGEPRGGTGIEELGAALEALFSDSPTGLCTTHTPRWFPPSPGHGAVIYRHRSATLSETTGLHHGIESGC
ncbi:hypothetical protein NDU88_002133 [Pleurodeles waltl]|uniref:Uncharacterized protein n=1 Tax=Pleurodeles waltl TaxID=8319 RepID=A0AAV7TKA5_PLEWA|nr:hypothetical protein NDU88_002133 [Pleurodeles waltl]